MGSESEEFDSGDNDNWQVIKRKRSISISPKKIQRKRVAMTNGPSTSSNMFQLLEQNNDDTPDDNNAIPKPPPIFIPEVVDIKSMVNNLMKIIKSEEFTYKSSKDGQVRLMIKSVESYRAVVRYLDNKKIKFHTYQLKQERSYRVVVKNLHFSTPVELIKQEIEKLGHKVRNISNVKSRVTKNPLSIFFVDLEPNNNNKDIYDVKFLFNAVVKIEPPLKNNDIVQCYRCQQFGHTKAYCRKLFRCVKCGLNHPTNQCIKEKNSTPQCSNCLQAHTASYKGCAVYKELLKKRNQIKKRNNNYFIDNKEPEFDVNAHNFPNISSNQGINNSYTGHNNNSNQFSYSQVVGNNSYKCDNLSASFQKIEALMEKQIETTTTLLKMMSTILTKLCN